MEERVKEIFSTALELGPDGRAAYLDNACGSDTALRRQVESLLRHADTGDGFLERPALGVSLVDDDADEERDADLVGERMGPYELLRRLGSGGMGAVYLAERADAEFEQRVAIKVVKRGMDTEEILKRFRRERQALAGLDHPNIARLLDGGTTRDGRPYLVMEHIEGERLMDWCDRRDLSIRERLDLFLTICSAVQSSHANLIVHRDLKPGNILVTNDGVPKLLDFGIAKLITPDGDADSEAITKTRHRFFTRDYASPEQIRGRGVTTASDIYSLGVVLYELLSGQRPYRLTAESSYEAERVICEVDPPLPSHAAGTGTDSGTARSERATRLRRGLSGDLDAIIMKAMRKEPARRYLSVEQFSEDIRRHLRGLPVEARRGTFRYRSGRFLRRHRLGIGAAALVVLSLIAGITMTALEARRTKIESAAAESTRVYLLDLYRSLDATSRRNLRDDVRAAVESDATRALLKDLTREPAVRIRFLEGLGDVCAQFHVYDLAISLYEQALAARRERGDDIPGSIRLLERLAAAFTPNGDAERAVALYEEALDLAEDGAPSARAELLLGLSRAHWFRGDLDAAIRVGEDALRASHVPELRVGAKLAIAGAHTDLGDHERAEAIAVGALSDYDASDLPRHRRGEVLMQAAAAVRPTPAFRREHTYLSRAWTELLASLPKTDPRVMECAARLQPPTWPQRGSIYKIKASFTACSKLVEECTRIYGEESLEAAQALRYLGRNMAGVDGAPRLEKAWRIHERILGPKHPRSLECRLELGRSLASWGNPALPFSKDEEAPKKLRRGIEHLRAALAEARLTLDENHPTIAKAASALGLALVYDGELAEAEPPLVEALTLFERTHGDDHPWTGESLARLVDLYRRRPSERLPELDDRLAMRRWKWPYGSTHGLVAANYDGEMIIDMDDDLAFRRISIDTEVPTEGRARLWILGRAYDWVFLPKVRRDANHHIRVNGEATLSFSAADAFPDLDQALSWSSFEIPLSWLRRGENTFSVYRGPFERDEWRDQSPKPWEFGNLAIATTTLIDEERSWWYGGGHCCDLIKDKCTKHSEGYYPPDGPKLNEHREEGIYECRGELMMFLEMVPE